MKPFKVCFLNEETEIKLLSENEVIRKAIHRHIESLKENAFCGFQIPKRLIPYDVNNLWKLNLPLVWRLLYTVASFDKDKYIVAIIDWMNHKEYAKLFGY